MRLSIALVAIVCAALAVPALAEKGDNPGKGGPPGKGAAKGNDNGQWQGPGKGRDGNQGGGPQGGIVIADRDRTAVYSYYRNQFATGGCPPGLAKKQNGCLPPGRAKKLYNVGQRYNRNLGNLWSYDQIPYELRNRYSFDRDDRYYYNQGYLYQVDPRTMLIQQVMSALLR